MIEKDVSRIIDEVKSRGDDAIVEYTKEFDNIILKNIKPATKKQIKDAYKKLTKIQINSLRFAAKRIRKFANAQMPCEFQKEFGKGIKLGQIIRPIEKVGCYVPGGNYPLPSTVLMTVIPAKIAGCSEVIVCTPPKTQQQEVIVDPATLVACDIAGADKIYPIGGVQAIAALAYGTKNIPKVLKIVGPGNKYVTEAKKQVFGIVDIDMLAGPSEVLIIADENADPKLIAADILAQAEHDINARCYLVSTSKKIIKNVRLSVDNQLKNLPDKNRAICKESIKSAKYILVENLDKAIDFSNEIAPEHLEIQAKIDISKIRNAGSIFIGKYSVEAAGDYCSGPNHTLPTRGFAKMRGGLSVLDFIKIISVQKLQRQGLENLKHCIGEISSMENLIAHKRSVEMR